MISLIREDVGQRGHPCQETGSTGSAGAPAGESVAKKRAGEALALLD